MIKSFVAGMILIVFSKIFPAWVVLIVLCCFLIYFLYNMYKKYLIRKAEKAEEVKRIEAEKTSSYSNYEDDDDEKSLTRKYFDGMYNPTSSDYYKPFATSLRNED